MPTYEYACPTCGIVEVFQSIKENALKKCPKCKKGSVTRIISGGGGVIFKGSGFWETDYNRSSDYESKSKAEKADAKGDAAPQTKGQTELKKSEPSTSTDTKSSDSKATPSTSDSSITSSDKPASGKSGSDKPSTSSDKPGTPKSPGPDQPSGGSSGKSSKGPKSR